MITIKIYVALLIFSQSVLFSQMGWFQQNSGTNKKVKSSYFLNDNTGYVVGEKGVILKSTNGGLSWSNIYDQVTYDIVTISFLNANTGWAFIGNLEHIDSAFVLKTSDAGGSWHKLFVDTIGLTGVAEIKFLNESTGYLVDYLNLRKTTDGGLNWIKLYSVMPFCLHFLNENTGWVGGYFTTLNKTTDGGETWNSQFQNMPNRGINDLVFFNEMTGFLTAEGVGIFKSTNSGDNWALLSIPSILVYPYSISFINENTGWVNATSVQNFTYRNAVLKTTNAGGNWSLYKSNLHGPTLPKIFFTSANIGWMVGDSGYIYKTTTGGATINTQHPNTEVPLSFSLFQNYPNPFNPVTTIKFELSGSRDVKLAVYDILGKEVAILVNESLKFGVYEVDFYGTNLPSGTYFYRMQAGDYTETKKMVLIK